MAKIGLILMQNQDYNLLKNVYFHYIISNTIFTCNIRGPKNGPFLESILHLFVKPLHIYIYMYIWFCIREKGTNVLRRNLDYSQMTVFTVSMENYIFLERRRFHLSKNI